MSTAFDQLLKDINDAESDPEKRALVIFDFNVAQKTLVRATAEAAAIPHWFDEAVIAALLPGSGDQSRDLLAQLINLPMVEVYPAEKREPAWNLHATTRLALRKRLIKEDYPRFLTLTTRAAEFFSTVAGPLSSIPERSAENIKVRIESIYHRLLVNPDQGIDELGRLLDKLLAANLREHMQVVANLIKRNVDEIWRSCIQSLGGSDNVTAWARAQHSLANSLKQLGRSVSDGSAELMNRAESANRMAFAVTTRLKRSYDIEEVNNRILIVDDNATIHEDFRRILSPTDFADANLDQIETEIFNEQQAKKAVPSFQLAFAAQGEGAMRLVAMGIQQGRPFAMAFVDIRMPPGMDGIETIKALWRIQPDLQVAICTAYADYSWDDIVDHLGMSHRLMILKKPFDPIEAIQLANAMTTKWLFERESALRQLKLQTALWNKTTQVEAARLQLQEQQDDYLELKNIVEDFNQVLDTIRMQAGEDVSSDNDPNTVLAAIKQATDLVHQLLKQSDTRVLSRRIGGETEPHPNNGQAISN